MWKTLVLRPGTSILRGAALPQKSLQRRSFQSAAEFAQWIQRVQQSAMTRPAGAVKVSPSVATPFLVALDPMAQARYTVWRVPTAPSSATSLPPQHSPAACYREVTLPLSTDEVVRTTVSDLGSWSTFRLSKFYELVDALTGDVAYAYTDTVDWVTGGHYHSRKLARTDLTRDVSIRVYPTRVGASSMEIRTDVWQEDKLVNVCHTIMVALDPQTMRPLHKEKTANNDTTNASISLPPLQITRDLDDNRHHNDTDDDVTQGKEAERLALAEWHDTIRKRRVQTTLQLRTAISTPPTPPEVQAVHELHQRAICMREGPAPRPPRPRTVTEYTFRSSFVIFPEHRNVHGKLFGGYVLSQGYNLALYAVKMFARVGPNDTYSIVPLGMDEAVFHQTVSIGDTVSFTARVVHATAHTARVACTVHVLDPTDPTRLPSRSNRLAFVFCVANTCADDDECFGILPHTYAEVLMQVEATRRWQVEGPTDEHAAAILAEAATATMVQEST